MISRHVNWWGGYSLKTEAKYSSISWWKLNAKAKYSWSKSEILFYRQHTLYLAIANYHACHWRGAVRVKYRLRVSDSLRIFLYGGNEIGIFKNISSLKIKNHLNGRHYKQIESALDENAFPSSSQHNKIVSSGLLKGNYQACTL